MSELRELYQEVILDHSKHPRNFRAIEPSTHSAHGRNPLCGDTLVVYADVADGTIRDLSFQGQGCAISTASASILTEALRGKSLQEARALFEKFHEMLTREGKPPASLGKLAVFAGVREFPVRVKCATLPWHTLKAALDRESQPASTE